jgi:copper(I)-binding protein
MPRPSRALLAVLAVLALVALAGCATGGDPAEAGASLRVVGATVAVPPNPAQASVRFVVENGTGRRDALVRVTSPAAAAVTVHRSVVDDQGMASMERVDELAIPARSEVAFEPGGLHVMLDQLREPLEVGDTIELTLTFAEAGTRTVAVRVVAPGASPNEMEHDVHGS